MIGSVSAHQEILREEKRKKKTLSIMGSFFSRRLSIELDQPSAPSGKTAHPN